MFLNRSSTLGLLIALSIIFAILLTFVVFKLWTYLQKNRKTEDESLSNEEEALDNFPPDLPLERGQRKSVPITCRTVYGQEPLKYEHRSASMPALSSLPLTTPMSPPRRTNLYQTPSTIMSRHGESIASILSECDEESLQLSSPQSPVENIRPELPVTSAAPQLIKKDTRRVINLRGASITEEMFIQSIHRPSVSNSGRKCRSLENIIDAQEDEDTDMSSDDNAPRPLHSTSHIMGGLQPKGIYKEDDSSGLKQRGLFKKGGKIVFKTRYTESKKELEVHILKAFDLASTRDMMEITPFVRICLLPGKKQKQDTKHKKAPTKEPFFNEKIIFEGIAKIELTSLKVNLKVCNHSRGIKKKKEVLGEAEVALSSIDVDEEKSFCVPLYQHRYKVTAASVLLSVCHEATLAKLVVIIHEAQLPKAAKSIIKMNPIATVVLYKGGVEMMTKQTSSKRMSSNPSFNERLEFDVRATTAEDLGTFSLDVKISDNKYVGKGSDIGHVLLSLNSSQKSAEEQWRNVVEVPHKYHRALHTLIDPLNYATT